MNRWAITAIVAIAALAVGFAIGAFVYDDDQDAATDSDSATTPEVTATVPADPAANETCLAALDEAERDLQAEERTTELLERYQSVLQEGSEALAEFDTRRLERLLTEVEALNQRSERLVEDSRNADISSAVETCRTVLGANGT